ncbi:hypothetical protein ANTPLA_LOCUS2953 [Anthophora plagiata]
MTEGLSYTNRGTRNTKDYYVSHKSGGEQVIDTIIIKPATRGYQGYQERLNLCVQTYDQIWSSPLIRLP